MIGDTRRPGSAADGTRDAWRGAKWRRAPMRRRLVGAALIAVCSAVATPGATDAGASSVEVSTVGTFATYQAMHDLFPLSLNDLLPGGTTAHQKILPTPTLCATGVTYDATRPVPGGSTAAKSALFAEESAAATARGCIDFAGSTTPPKPGSATASTYFDYYAYALDAVAPLVGSSAGGSRESPPVLTLADMKNIYRCKPGFTRWKTVTGGVTAPIVRFWPSTGSGTRSLYTDMFGFTAEKAHSTTAASTCTTAPYTSFSVAGRTKANRASSEAGIIYQASIDPTTPVDDAISVYSVGRFVDQWNAPGSYGTKKVNPITGTAIGNFAAKTLFLAQMKNRSTTVKSTTQPFADFNAQTGTFTQNTKRGTLSANSAVIKESNEWYSHIAGTATGPTASTATVPGVRYVYNVADSQLPTYSEAKLMVGFDNQKRKVLTSLSGVTRTYVGARSALCDGDDAPTIVASGLVPLNAGTTAPGTSDLVGATCREFPGKHYPGRTGLSKSWAYNGWANTGETVATTTGAPYAQQSGYPAINDTGTTLAVTTAAVGDILLVMAHTAPSSGSSHVASISDSNSRVTWQSAKSAGFTNHVSGDAVEIWYGVVKSVGATTVDVHWSGTTFDHFVWASEWKSSRGPAVTWSVAASGIKNSIVGSGSTCAFPTLTSSTKGGLYWGWAYPESTSHAGTTSGFSYYVTAVPTHGNVMVSNGSLADSTSYTPTFTQTKATTWYDAAAVIVVAKSTAT